MSVTSPCHLLVSAVAPCTPLLLTCTLANVPPHTLTAPDAWTVFHNLGLALVSLPLGIPFLFKRTIQMHVSATCYCNPCSLSHSQGQLSLNLFFHFPLYGTQFQYSSPCFRYLSVFPGQRRDVFLFAWPELLPYAWLKVNGV